MVIARRSGLCFVAVGLAALLASRHGHAQGAPLDRAKELFRQGNELRKAGDCGRALAFYLESRALVPSVANTTNAAVCLTQLARDDEALEMYEELLLRFRADLSDEETRTLASAMADLRRKVGRVEVSSNVQGLVVIDGRPRGQLPLVSAIPLHPGPHVLRVIKEGYETYEQKLAVQVGATVAVDARLVAFTHAGRVRLNGTREDEGAEVAVDGAVIGAMPWEGTLAPGPHRFAVRKANRGTAPLQVNVVENQTVVQDVALTVLGAELRVVPEPPSAKVSIDGVPVGEGEWRGALPVGRHTLEVREEAYLPLTTSLESTSAPRDVLSVRLAVDPAHPRWTVPRSGYFWAEAFGALAVASGLGSGAELACDRVTCKDQGAALGGVVGARVGYQLPFGLAVHVSGGYLALRTSLQRSIDSAFAATPVTYDLEDRVSFSGPFASAGLGYVLPLGRTFDVGARADLGVVFAGASDAVRGTISGGGRTLDLAIQRSGSAVHAAAPFVLPALVARMHLGSFYVGLGAALGLFFVKGPALETGDAAPTGFDCASHPAAADCAPASALLHGERAFGPAVVALPSIELGAIFR